MPAPPPSNFNLPTFVVAAVGAATGLFSAGWNVVPYVSSGAKIRVTIHYIYDMRAGPVFEVTAYNKRRGPVEIRNWGVRTYHEGSRKHYTTVLMSGTLESGFDSEARTIQGLHGAAWRIEAPKLTVFDVNRRSGVKVKGLVNLGNGKVRKSKSLKLEAGSLHQAPRVVED
jgi:hypothetical protein